MNTIQYPYQALDLVEVWGYKPELMWWDPSTHLHGVAGNALYWLRQYRNARTPKQLLTTATALDVTLLAYEICESQVGDQHRAWLQRLGTPNAVRRPA